MISLNFQQHTSCFFGSVLLYDVIQKLFQQYLALKLIDIKVNLEVFKKCMVLWSCFSLHFGILSDEPFIQWLMLRKFSQDQIRTSTTRWQTELTTNTLYLTWKLDEFRAEIQRRDQEILAMSAKMKTLEEQHQDYQRHIAVLKESLCAKEEHYNMMQADVRVWVTQPL